MQMRAAVLEMQTMGALIARKAENRAPTGTDKSLCDPLLAAFLDALPRAIVGTDLDGWIDGITLGKQFQSSRAAGLMLDDGAFCVIRMAVDLGVADRQGVLLVALPVIETPSQVAVNPPSADQWGADIQDAVSRAPATLDALLHRFTVPLALAQTLGVGTVLPLHGCTVSSVRLIAPDGQEVAQAKLGQIGGMRAVRMQTAPLQQLGELATGEAGGQMMAKNAGALGISGSASVDYAAQNVPDVLGSDENMQVRSGHPEIESAENTSELNVF